MIRLLLIWLSVISYSCCHSLPESEQSCEYVAVFSNPGFGFLAPWLDCRYDYRMIGYSWEDFDKFVQEVARRTKGRQLIVLDIDCHGSDDGLYLEIDDEEYRASFGYVTNEIDRYLAKHHGIVLLTEACYSGRAYKQTIRNNPPASFCYQEKTDDHPRVPAYPIYGIGSSTPTWGNYIFRQYKNPQARLFFEDLRKYEVCPLKRWNAPDSLEDRLVYLTYQILCATGGGGML